MKRSAGRLTGSAGVGGLEVSARARATRAATKTTTPRIRVRPIPETSPPLIDSRSSVLLEPNPFVQGTLAITFAGADRSVGDPEDDHYFERQHTLSSDLPDPAMWVAHIAQALVEVMSGARPAPQVIRWTTPEVYSVVARRNAVSGRRTAVGRRAVVRRVRVREPVDGVVEACAVVVDSGRVRALAIRMVGVDRRWVVSVLQVG